MNFMTPEDLLPHLHSLPQGNFAEFGTYHGDVMGRLIKGANDWHLSFQEVWGFDSWEGLPKETDGLWLNPDWPEHAFSVQQRYGLQSREDCVQFVSYLVQQYTQDYTTPLNFVSGFFSESLTDELGVLLKDTVSLCHVDVDLYISTKQVLDWLLTYKVLKVGALVRFDDWLYNGQHAGNNRAFWESNNKFGTKWLPLADNVYILSSYNK